MTKEAFREVDIWRQTVRNAEQNLERVKKLAKTNTDKVLAACDHVDPEGRSLVEVRSNASPAHFCKFCGRAVPPAEVAEATLAAAS